MPKAAANGIEIEYEAFGAADAPSVLLISGLGTPMIRWATPFCETLAARGFRVIRFDNRDVGLSTHLTATAVPDMGAVFGALARGGRPDIPYSLQDMAEDSVALLGALGLAKAHIVGRSMGGMIAQLVAITHPTRVRSLISIMSTTGNPGLPRASSAAMEAMRSPAPRLDVDEAAFLAHALRIAHVIAGTRYPFDEDFARAQALTEARRAYDPDGAARQLIAVVAAGDRRERLKTIPAPTLVIHGTEDRLLSPAAGQDTAAHIPGAELKLVEGMGHEIPPGMYAEMAGWIAEFAGRAG